MCSSEFFTKYYGLTGKEAALKAAHGDAEALAIWKMFGRHLGELIKATLFTYDPEMIVIGWWNFCCFLLLRSSYVCFYVRFPVCRNVEKSANTDYAES